jgi:hypothetical protein
MNKILTRFQIHLSLSTVVLIVLYGPLLELIKKNQNIQDLYGMDYLEFVLLFLIGFLIPWGISLFICLKRDNLKKYVFSFWIITSLFFFVSSQEFWIKFLTLIFGLLFLIPVIKNLNNFIKIFSLFALIVIPDTCYKNYRLIKSFVGFHFMDQISTDFKLRDNKPSNIFFFLLDGTDLTSSYLDEDKLPRNDLLPNLHQAFKNDFLWFPNAHSNSPQTFLSVPIMFTGIVDYDTAKEKFNSSEHLFNFASQAYKIQGYFYRSYYQAFCSVNIKSCHPFGKINLKLSEHGSIVAFIMYLHQMSWKLVPFKSATEFKPPKEAYTFDDFYKKVEEIEPTGNFIYFHVFRRSLYDLTSFDAEFKTFVDLLKNRNMYENSMIVITSDHGMDFTQSPHTYGRLANFTPRVFKIPIALKPVGQGLGKTQEFVAQSTDIFPSILESIFLGSFKNDHSRNLFLEDYSTRKILINCDKNKSPGEFLNDYYFTGCKNK